MEKGLFLNNKELVRLFDFAALAEDSINFNEDQAKLALKIKKHLKQYDLLSECVYLDYGF
jgi:hypothetical protein